MRDCPYCGEPMPIDRTRSCGELECRRAIASGKTTRPRRQDRALSEFLPARDFRFLSAVLKHPFAVRTW